MSVYETYLKEKSKPKSTKGSVYSSYLKRQELARVPAEKARLIEQGLPVSVSDKRARPTGIGNFIRGATRLVADVGTNLVNAGQIAVGAKETQPFSGKFLGEVKGLGKIDITKSPFEKENLKVILNSASTGAEIASYLSAGGVAKKTIAGLTARGVLASKATFAEWVVQNFPKLAKEGFIQGIAYTLGSQGRENVATGKPFSGEQAIKDIAFSTIGNVAIPATLRGAFGTSSKRILNARETERAISDARILGRPIPQVGAPSAKFMTESGRTLPAPRTPGQIPIELPGKGILESQAKLRETSIPTQPSPVKSALTKEADLFSSRDDFIKSQIQKETIIKQTRIADTPQAKRAIGKTLQDFIGNEISFLRRIKQNIPANTQKKLQTIWEKANKKPIEIPPPPSRAQQLAKIWDDAHSSTPTKITPKTYSVPAPTAPAPKVSVGMKTNSYGKRIPDTSTPAGATPAPASTPTVPKAENVLQKDVERMADEVEGFEPGTFIEWSNTIRQLDPDEIMNVAMGGEKSIPNNIPSNAYLSIAKNIAEETGNVKMVKELASSDVASKAGQGLVSSKITTAGNIVDDLREVVLQKIRNKKLNTNKLTREQGALFERAKANLRQFSKGTKQDIDNIINSLICK